MVQAAALTAVLAIALGGCSDGDSDKQADPSTGSSAANPTASESNADAGLVGAPEIGTCWQVPPAKAGDEEYWFDGSPQVPCTERHTTQTVAVYSLDEPTPKLVMEEGGHACGAEARTFIGTADWVPWRSLYFLPSRDQVASGASWVRCDVSFAAQTAGARPVWRRGSAEEVVLRRPEEVWGCLDKFPQQPTRPQPFVPCDKPHTYEATGHELLLEDFDTYPSPRQLRAAAAECQFDHRNPDYKGLTGRALWRPPNEVFDGYLFGSCWASRPDGQDVPPLR